MRPSITPARDSASQTRLNRCEICGDDFVLTPVGSMHQLLASQDLCRVERVIPFGLKAAVFGNSRWPRGPVA